MKKLFVTTFTNKTFKYSNELNLSVINLIPMIMPLNIKAFMKKTRLENICCKCF